MLDATYGSMVVIYRREGFNIHLSDQQDESHSTEGKTKRLRCFARHPPDLPEIKHFLFFSDNQAALKSIDDLSDHPAQGASIIFWKHIDSLLSDPSRRVSLSWIPGHHGFHGNEEADTLAKEAVNFHPLLHSTTSWALERAKARALKHWRKDWLHLPHTNLAAMALHKRPPCNCRSSTRNMEGPAISTLASSRPSSAMVSLASTTADFSLTYPHPAPVAQRPSSPASTS
ncbi:hypothetical protein BU17DRAFT_96595 [Hysterangium stoloniferum]|nr:hypothetical protein BU17DRAFT_96595 [Hysterangium stoloniferum]